ncbi:YcxB family protein [Methylomagnum sp.]
MSEIEYELREQDLLAFNDHQLQSSGKLGSTLRRHQGTVPGILMVIALVMLFYYEDTLSAMYVGFTGAAWGVLTPLYLKWNARRQIRGMYTEDEKARIVGVYKLRTTSDALVEIGREGESRVKWGDILRIEATKKYAFIFVTIDSALIVPRATVKNGDLHEFVKDVDQRIEAAS